MALSCGCAGAPRLAPPSSTRTTAGFDSRRLITVESLPPQLGGSPERAREHFERAVELSDGLDAAPYVTLALGVSVPEENRAEFEDLLNRALAIDPDENTSQRLLNVVNQRRARLLLDVVDDLFFE